MNADLALVNGGIYTMDPARPSVEALAASAGRVVALGASAAVQEYLGPRTEILDLRGHTAVPGLADAHLHFAAYGLALQETALAGARSPAEAAERAKARAQGTPAGEWVRGRGWDRNLWSPPDLPRREVLDAVVPGHPVALESKDGHALWLNTAGLEQLGFGAASADAWGAQVVRDERSGEPAGVLLEEAAGVAMGRLPRPGLRALRRAISVAIADAHRLGLTSVHDCEGGQELAALLDIWREGALRLRIYMLIPSESLEAAAALGLRSGFGDDWLRVGHLKVFADGALGSHTADMLAPYEGEPENRGIAMLEGDGLRAVVEQAARAGIAVATHAIGDRANRRVLEAYQQTQPLWSAEGLRPRIEHVQLLAPPDVARLGQLGVVASMQPIHATSDMEMAERYWGDRCEGAYAWRSLLDAGTVLAFGSDCPVETLDPLAGIYAAVTRRRADGAPAGGWRPEQALTAYEALRAYTWGAAYAAGEERERGSLAVGKVADLAILSQDILQCSTAELRNTQVLCTVCGGRVVYSTGLLKGQ